MSGTLAEETSQMKIALIFGGLGLESSVSALSAEAVSQALDQLGHSHFKAPVDEGLSELLISKKPDLAFISAHGTYGEDGLPQALCEILKIPYTGSGVLASALCMDKVFVKKFFLKNKFPSPSFQLVDSSFRPEKLSSFPVVVKASHGGSSLGTHIVERASDLPSALQKAKEIGREVFIEEYIPNSKEIAISLLEDKILSPVEIEPKGDFYDYRSKYTQGASLFFIPARVDPFVLERMKSLAREVFQAVGVRGYARADFLLRDGKSPFLLEINSLPGLTPHSLLPKAAQKDGIEFHRLIEKIIQMAQRDYS